MKAHPRSAARLALGLSLASAGCLFARASHADEKAECLAAASKGQTLRDAHSLIEAREQFQTCARRVCPAIVQTDCGSWLDTVEKTLPSVVLSAKDAAGRDLLDVNVTADGRPLAQKLDGQAVWMNPGVHSFRFELADGTTATSRVVVKEGEKAQGVAVVLGSPAAVEAGARSETSPDSAATTPAEPVKPVASGRGATQRALGLVLGGLGIVGIGVGSGIGLDAKSKDNAAAREKGTAAGEIDSRSDVNQGNVGTAVFVAGAVVAAVGVVVWFTAPSAKVAVGMDGSEVWVRGVF
jgi:hypothetical protein